MIAPLSGSLVGYDRTLSNASVAKTFSLYSSGALRYRPGPGARINLVRNPGFKINLDTWSTYNGGTATSTLTRDTSQGVIGSACARVDVNNVDTGSNHVLFWNAMVAASAAPVGKPGTYTVSCYVFASTADQFRVQVNAIPLKADGSGGAVIYGPNFTITATNPQQAQRLTTTLTVTDPQTHYLSCQFAIRAVTGIQSGTVWFDNIQVEEASVATPYFDASTLPTAAWLDPNTGQLGTAHNSPSVEWAQAWNEEGTTNEIRDPVFGNATITNHWGTVGAGTTLARTTAYAVPYGGVAAAQVTCDGTVAGQGLTLLSTVAPAAASGQTKTAQIAARGSGTVKIQIVGLDSANAVTETFESSAITLDNTWKTFPNIPKLTATFANASTVKYVVRLVTTTAQAVTFYVGYVGSEPKAYATSPCHGSLGTGYSWSGAAHASSSTRAVTEITTASTGRIDFQRGSFVAWINYPLNRRGYVIRVGNVNRLYCYVDPNGSVVLGSIVNGGTNLKIALPAGTVLANTLSMITGTWDGTAIAVRVNLGSWVTGSRDDPTGVTFDGLISLGAYSAGAGDNSNGGNGPVLIFDRPLTDAEIAAIYAAGPVAAISGFNRSESSIITRQAA